MKKLVLLSSLSFTGGLSDNKKIIDASQSEAPKTEAAAPKTDGKAPATAPATPVEWKLNAPASSKTTQCQ